ncbi:MAG: endo alpha-1,4 polygalactosaminidase [Candidatus Obscuribacterales bacterium]|nr:endo alpha-1,4 polygalactosaminidase [Candidatus Obscuribacterales bacterium]
MAEQAYRYQEAGIYQPMPDQGKPVFLIEYKKPSTKNIQDGFNMIQAKKALKGKTKMLTPS